MLAKSKTGSEMSLGLDKKRAWRLMEESKVPSPKFKVERRTATATNADGFPIFDWDSGLPDGRNLLTRMAGRGFLDHGWHGWETRNLMDFTKGSKEGLC